MNSAATRYDEASVIVRGAALLAALLLEIVLIDGGYSFRSAVAGEAPVWQAINDSLQAIVYITLYSALALCVLAFAQRRDVAASWINAAREHRWLPWVAAQSALFGLIFVMTPHLQAGGERAPWGLFGVWLIASAGLVASAVLAIAPLSFWRAQVKQHGANLVAALIAGASIYVAITLARESWRLLSDATLSASYWLLKLYEPGAFTDYGSRVLGARGFEVIIDAPCSGYEGMGLVLGVLGFYIFAFRHELRFPHVLVLLPIGAATIWVLNAVRLALLVSIGAHVSPDLALQGFHSQAGWIFFLIVTVSLMVLAHRTPALRATANTNTAPVDPAIHLAAALLIPFAALMASRIVASIFGEGPNWAEAISLALPISAVVAFRREIGRQLGPIGFEPILLGLAVGAFWIVTDFVSPGDYRLGLWLDAQAGPAAAAWIIFRIAGFALVVPIAEELAFRGYLHRALIGRRFERVAPHAFTWLAFIGTTLAFGALHQRWLSGAIAGAVFAIALYRSKSLTGPITAHIVANAVIAFYAVATESWDLL